MILRRNMALTAMALGLTLSVVEWVEASPERLEADLQAVFGTRGSLSIGELSSPRMTLSQRSVAEALVFESDEGGRVLIDRYTVSGDYEAPDAVEIEGLRVEDKLTGLTVIDIASLTFDTPSHAVFPLHDASLPASWHAKGLTLDAMHLDLNRMIEMARPTERVQLRMASNVLTDGSGVLNLDAAFTGGWQSEGDAHRLVSESRIDITDAVRLAFDTDLPVAIPPGVEPAEYLAGLDDFETLTLLGGDVVLHLEDLGLFGRIASVGAAMAGVTERQYVEQTRTQAQGFGMMLGREVQAILLALADMLAGQTNALTISASLPAESDLATYRDDPLGLPQRLDLTVETR